MVQENLESQRPSRNTEFAERAKVKVETHVAESLAQLSSGDADEVSLRQHHPLARFRDPHPVFDLFCSLLSLGLTSGATGIKLTPSPDSVDVQVEVNGVFQKAVILPKALQEPLVARLKDAASLDVTEQGPPQTGGFQADWQNKDFDILLSFIPTENGERVIIRFVPR